MRKVIFAVLFVVTAAMGQWWTGPYALTFDPGDDVNPSACKEWVDDHVTCLVWQSDRSGDWDVYARFCEFDNGNGWLPEEAVSTDSADDVNPSVACRSGYPGSTWFWCVWERRQSPWVGEVWASFSDMDSWQTPVRIGRTLHGAPGDSSEPSAIVIKGGGDTTWVVWSNRDTSGSYISCSFHDGDSWSQPHNVVYSAHEIRHARIGRGYSSRGNWEEYPFLVWEQEDDIWYSEYLSGAWTTPDRVAPSAALDRDPEVLSYAGWMEPRSGVVWQSTRDGDTAIFGALSDSLNNPARLCDTAGAGRNWTPQAAYAACPIDEWWFYATTVWVSDRSGNSDIHCSANEEDGYVDSHPAVDCCPTVTTMGLTQVWCCWQSDRSGNWDLHGSFTYCTGVEEMPNGELRMPNATIVRGVLYLPQVRSQSAECRTALLDIGGRKVAELQPGENDVRHLSPGVYFIRGEGPRGQGSEGSSHKVVIQR